MIVGEDLITPAMLDVLSPVRFNLGCGRQILPGWINLDLRQAPGVDVVANLDDPEVMLPYPENFADEFLLSHVLEHIHHTLPLMQELHRIAKPGAMMTIRVPYGSSDDAWEDPTHVRAYFLESFGFFSQFYYWKTDYCYRGDWETETIQLRCNEIKTLGEMQQKLRHERNVVREMVATLRAIKPIRDMARGREERRMPPIQFVPI